MFMNPGLGNRVTFVERTVFKMLRRMRVRFVHRAFVAGKEVDFLIPRPGRRGLLVEVDGDLWHMDERKREARDRILMAEGWCVVHYWASEVVHTPACVRDSLERHLEGVPRVPKKKRKEEWAGEDKRPVTPPPAALAEAG